MYKYLYIANNISVRGLLVKATYDNHPQTPSEWIKTVPFDASRINYQVNPRLTQY